MSDEKLGKMIGAFSLIMRCISTLTGLIDTYVLFQLHCFMHLSI